MAKKQPDTTIGPVVQVQDLTAGINLSASPTNLKPNMARRLVNADISTPGELGILPGWAAFSTTSLGGRRCQGGKRIYLSGSTFKLGADNGSVYKPTDAGVWGAAVKTGLHATNQIDFVYDRDIAAVLDGSNVPSKTVNGTTWTQLGITAPSAPSISAVNNGGTLTDANTFEVAYAYGDSTLNAVSSVSDSDTVATASPNLTVRVPVTASAAADVDEIRVYARNVTAGETVMRLQGTYANSSTNIDITTNNWDAQEEAPDDHGVSVACSFGVVWKNRWWMRDATVKNRIRFSQIFQPQAWPSTFYVDIPFERGDDATLFVPLGDTLVVFGYTRFYLILGQTSLDFEVRPALGAQTGALGFRAGDVVESGVLHAGASGVYLYNGAADELLTLPIDEAWRQYISGASAANLAATPMTYHKPTKHVRIAVTQRYPSSNPGEFILDLNRSRVGEEQAWTATDRTVGGYIQWDGKEATAGDFGRLFSWDLTTAKLYEESVGASANGADITMDYDGFTLPTGLQSARFVETYIEYQPTAGTLTVDLKVDGQLMGTQSFSLGSNLSRYGTAVYGTGTYGGSGRRVLPVMWPLRAEGKAAQLLLRYTGQGDPKIYTYGHNVFKEPIPRGI